MQIREIEDEISEIKFSRGSWLKSFYGTIIEESTSAAVLLAHGIPCEIDEKAYMTPKDFWEAFSAHAPLTCCRGHALEEIPGVKGCPRCFEKDLETINRIAPQVLDIFIQDILENKFDPLIGDHCYDSEENSARHYYESIDPNRLPKIEGFTVWEIWESLKDEVPATLASRWWDSHPEAVKKYEALANEASRSIEQLEARTGEINDELENLGFFSGKKKRKLLSELDEAKAKIEEKKRALKSLKNARYEYDGKQKSPACKGFEEQLKQLGIPT